ncbi:hypothetical protein GCM10010218_55800 [Streptomyces mashuensis]|uniref:Uncharacterized protein n=2 Tax=Streptomyces mashuensis TaxID=33904 RepID=A0A919B7K6_9ACTN|nr:hypothetical protein GCM10010218_55800 [Streptomyces mashuensis]
MLKKTPPGAPPGPAPDTTDTSDVAGNKVVKGALIAGGALVTGALIWVIARQFDWNGGPGFWWFTAKVAVKGGLLVPVGLVALVAWIRRQRG